MTYIVQCSIKQKYNNRFCSKQQAEKNNLAAFEVPIYGLVTGRYQQKDVITVTIAAKLMNKPSFSI